MATFDTVGNHSAWMQVRGWFASNAGPVLNSILIIEGPCGVGKTYNVMGLASEFRLDVHELHCLARRDAAAIRGGICEARGKSIHGNRKLLFIDDIQLCDEGGIDALVKEAMACSKSGRRLPHIVITCRNYWDWSIRGLRRMKSAGVPLITLKGIDPEDMLNANRLVDLRAERIAMEVAGDYRQFLLRLDESASTAVDARFKDIFTKTRFLTSTSEDVELRASIFATDPSMLSNMLFENYTFLKFSREREQRASYYADLFSLADISRGQWRPTSIGGFSPEMATVLSNSIHANPSIPRMADARLRQFKTPDIRDVFHKAPKMGERYLETDDIQRWHRSTLVDIPNSLCPWFKV